MFIVPLLFILLLVLAVIFIFRIGTYNTPNNADYIKPNQYISNYNKPIDILKERYAKGEITEEEFLKIKRNLES